MYEWNDGFLLFFQSRNNLSLGYRVLKLNIFTLKVENLLSTLNLPTPHRSAASQGRRLALSRPWGNTLSRALERWLTTSSRTTSTCPSMYVKCVLECVNCYVDGTPSWSHILLLLVFFLFFFFLAHVLLGHLSCSLSTVAWQQSSGVLPTLTLQDTACIVFGFVFSP